MTPLRQHSGAGRGLRRAAYQPIQRQDQALIRQPASRAFDQVSG